MNVYEDPAKLEEKSRMNASSVLVLLSGGQDSTTCLFHAIHSPTVFNRVGALAFDYGQRHSRELDSASFVYELAHHYIEDGVHMDPWIRIKKLGNVFEGNSPLTTNNPLEEYRDVTEMDAKLQDRVELTFVPGRNAVFLALAYSYATAWGYDSIMTGVNAADAGNYPDCTPEFVSSIARTMELATRQTIKIYTPLQGKSKKDIVELGNGLAGCMRAMAFTTTDYAGAYPPLQNHSSVLRASGFSAAKTPDPLIERARFEGVLR